MSEPEPFATHTDLELRWHTLLADEQTQADELLADASDKIRQQAPKANDPQWTKAHSRTLTRVCCGMVKRALQQQESGMPAGVTQSSESTGPFVNGYTWSNPDGSLYLTAEDRKDLGIGIHHAFSVQMIGVR
jgi:hypothetical protein